MDKMVVLLCLSVTLSEYPVVCTVNKIFYRYKDGDLLYPDERISQNVAKDGVCTMVIKPVADTDTGDYECEIKQDADSIRSKAKVIVDGKFIFSQNII